MQTVLYLPGLLGSNLAIDQGPIWGRRRLWSSFQAMADGGLARIQLAADGRSPGPLAQGQACLVDGQLVEVYGPLALWLAGQGFDLHPLAFDWRLSLVETGDALAAFISQRLAGKPVWIVAHSMGGLVARLAWRVLRGQGLDQQIRRLITLGTPHYGSFSIPQTFGHLDASYKAIASAGLVAYGFNTNTAIQYLDAVLGSFPGVYELLPFRRYGPLAAESPLIGDAIYSINSYNIFNAYVSQMRLDATQATQQLLNDAIWPDRQISVVGYGIDTPNNINLLHSLNDRKAYASTQEGDGRVPVAYSTLPSVPRAFFRAEHGLMPLLPGIWQFIRANLVQGISADVRS